MKNIISLASSSNEKSSIGAIILLDSFPVSSFESFSLDDEFDQFEDGNKSSIENANDKLSSSQFLHNHNLKHSMI